MKNKFTMRGEYLIEIIQDGKIIARHKIKNTLTTISQTSRDQMLMGTYTATSDALQIKYFAFGTGSTPATPADTQLQTEIYRKQVTQLTNPSTGTVKSVVSLGTQEVNTIIREIGVFCGPDATSTTNTGTLLSRVNVSITKNSNIALNIIRTDSAAIN